jgi:hypothetical protein
MRRLIMTLVVFGLLSSACSTGASDEEFQLDEFTIEGPNSLTAGDHELTVSNVGEFPHTLVVTDGAGQVMAASDLIQPGEMAGLSVDLANGRYVFTCRIVAQNDSGELIDHFEAGMTATVDVSG